VRGADGGSVAARLAGAMGALLGWSPTQFWAATPAEVGAVVRALTGEAADAAPPDAATLKKLREAFPDE
jgi:hypothetical protein